jgi:S1-C subfamily serine protease
MMNLRNSGNSSSRRGSLMMPCAALLLASLIGASPVSTQVDTRRARESFQAIQRQVDSVEGRLIKATVALQLGGVSGSGVIISPDGYVLTAAHVIAGRHPRPCRVTLADGRRMQATVLGSNGEEDFGLIKIDDAKDLPTAPIGDSSTLRPGQWVLATGHPLGLHRGRPPVLRIGRVLGGPRRRTMREGHRILTDAPLISGDSGGPLFDLNGRIVGIHSMITEGDRWMASIHVPVNLAKVVLSQLERGEEPTEDDIRNAPVTRAIHDADAALQDGEYAAAARSAAEAAKLDDTSATARLLLARADSRVGKAGAALTALEEAADRGCIDPSVLRQDPDLARIRTAAPFQKVLARLDSLNGVPGSRKGDRSILDAAEGVDPNGGRGVAAIFAGSTQVTLGTVMSADGDILTKASELPDGDLTCRLPDGSTLPAQRGAVDSAWDVALLKVKATKLAILPFAKSTDLGHWTFTPEPTGTYAALGVIGVAEMPVYGTGIAPRPTSKAYMGAFLVPVPPSVLKEMDLPAGVAVEVTPNTPAAKAGLQTGDIVVEIDGKPAKDPDGIMDLMLNKNPGDALAVRVARDKERLTYTVNLGSRPLGIPGRGGLAEMLSGEVSRKAGPFPRVVQHDAVLAPKSMGGPVLDSDGNIVGMNIARADRTSTYAIPAKELADIYAHLKNQK